MSDRIYQGKDQLWYYRTRGNDAGPFQTRQDAERKLSSKVRSWQRQTGMASFWPRHWHPLRMFRRSATRQSS